MKNLFIIILLLSLSSCRDLAMDRVYSVRIRNNSEQDIRCVESYRYPDTSLAGENVAGVCRKYSYIYIDSSEPWEERIAKIPGKKISIFFLNIDTLNTYPWETIRSDYKIIKRIDLSLEDMENNDFIVDYP